MISDNEVLLLSDLIKQNLQKEFSEKHLSKNLINTIVIEKTTDGVSVIIPAEIYNMYKYFKEGIIIRRGNGSYASELDTNGSAFMWYPKSGQKGKRKLVEPRNHIGYVDKIVRDSVEQWKNIISEKHIVGKTEGL